QAQMRIWRIDPFDGNGNLTQMKDALSDVTTYTNNAMGFRTSMTDPDGHVTTYTLDARNRQTNITDAAGGVVTMTYDSGSNMLTLWWSTESKAHVRPVFSAANAIIFWRRSFVRRLLWPYHSARPLIHLHRSRLCAIRLLPPSIGRARFRPRS